VDVGVTLVNLKDFKKLEEDLRKECMRPTLRYVLREAVWRLSQVQEVHAKEKVSSSYKIRRKSIDISRWAPKIP
jgi:hypothetical protein